MLKKLLCSIVILYTSIVVSGCATSAETSGMVAQSISVEQPKSPRLLHNISVISVSGGSETNPLWMSKVNNSNFQQALEVSLRNSRLYHELENSPYGLRVELVKLDQPLFGIDMTVTSQVRYTLYDQKTNRVVYTQLITSEFTATFSDTILGVKRERLASEGAAKANIQQLIQALYKVSLSH